MTKPLQIYTILGLVTIFLMLFIYINSTPKAEAGSIDTTMGTSSREEGITSKTKYRTDGISGRIGYILTVEHDNHKWILDLYSDRPMIHHPDCRCFKED